MVVLGQIDRQRGGDAQGAHAVAHSFTAREAVQHVEIGGGNLHALLLQDFRQKVVGELCKGVADGAEGQDVFGALWRDLGLLARLGGCFEGEGVLEGQEDQLVRKSDRHGLYENRFDKNSEKCARVSE